MPFGANGVEVSHVPLAPLAQRQVVTQRASLDAPRETSLEDGSHGPLQSRVGAPAAAQSETLTYL